MAAGPGNRRLNCGETSLVVTRLYFAYGSNMHPGRMRSRLAASVPRGVACLANYRLAFHKRGRDGSGKGDIIVAAGAEVWGVVYELEAEHVAVLDRIEGVDYTRETLQVRRHSDGNELSALVYRARAGAIVAGLQPFNWYLDFLLHGAAHHGLPEHYARWLSGISAIRDPDSERTKRERALLKLR